MGQVVNLRPIVNRPAPRLSSIAPALDQAYSSGLATIPAFTGFISM